MKELKILGIIIVIVGVLYWGVEPLAHKTFHPEVAKPNFDFSDLGDVRSGNSGNAEQGKALVEANCTACHTAKNAGLEGGEIASFSRDGKDATIFTPDISTAGVIYSENFLAGLIADPAKALHLAHKFPDGDFPMIAYYGEPSEIADMVAYLKSIGEVALKQQVLDSEEFIAGKEAIEKSDLSESARADKIAKLENHLTDKAVFLNACSRCHSVKYDGVVPQTSPADLNTYLGSAAPDLSMVIRAKGAHYLEHFINDPQNVSFKAINDAIIKKEGKLPATNDKRDEWQDARDFSNYARELGVMPVGLSMPRVGLTQEAQERVISYLESVGDSKKAERENLGIYIMIFFGVLSVLAYLWKRKIWSEVH